jgi:hypothetical protein
MRAEVGKVAPSSQFQGARLGIAEMVYPSERGWFFNNPAVLNSGGETR